MRPPPPREVDAASTQLDRLVIQRPAKLERLSSTATTATARASSPLDNDSPPQTATQSPRHSHASDLSSLFTSSGASASKSPRFNTDMPSRTTMTSPDSWRSLLPEHDPYFASDLQLRTSRPDLSPHSLPPTSSPFDIDAYAAAKSSPRISTSDRMSSSSVGTSRTSFSSIISSSGPSTMSMSHPSMSNRQSQDSVRSDSWRSLLPDDDRYHASRDANTAIPSSSGLSPNLASPSLSDRLESPTSSDGYHQRSALLALHTPRSGGLASKTDSDSAARRHASFSSVEHNDSTAHSATRVMLASARPFTKSASQHFERSALAYASSSSSSSSTGVVSPPARDSLEAPHMTPELSQSTAEDDSGERDSWPTSRMGRYGSSSSSSTGPSTPETALSPEHGPTPKGKLTAAALEEQNRTPLRITKTSDVTGTTTEDESTLATTTTARPSLHVEPTAPAYNKARSEADVGDSPKISENGDEGFQHPAGRQRTSSCSISTPISPSCMPFFGKRSAPAGASISMETERSKYVVLVCLPGFSLNCITLATKRNAHGSTLHVVADKWDAEGGGHFERRVHFSEKDCDLANVKAEFDGNTLRVTLPRKSKAGSLSSSSSSVRF